MRSKVTQLEMQGVSILLKKDSIAHLKIRKNRRSI
jgi:hypothetical protein